MKKTIMVLVFILVAVSISAQEKEESSVLRFNYQMELGYLPLNGWALHDTIYSQDGLNFYFNLKAEVLLLDFLFAGGSMRSTATFKNDGSFYFNPSEIWFGFFTGIRIGGLEIGFRHSCFHPILTYVHFMPSGTTNAEGAYEELYVSFKGSVKLF
jgi:hypothetical protein